MFPMQLGISTFPMHVGLYSNNINSTLKENQGKEIVFFNANNINSTVKIVNGSKEIINSTVKTISGRKLCSSMPKIYIHIK